MTICEIINEILKYKPKAKKWKLWNMKKEKLENILEKLKAEGVKKNDC